MNTIERQRPIRLTFSGEVESYDWQTARWIRDLSRDPRELIPLSYPPAADAYLSAQKATCANAIAHQLRASLNAQDGLSGTSLDPDIWDNLAVGGFGILGRAGLPLQGNQWLSSNPPHLPIDGLFWNVAYLIAAEWGLNQAAFELLLDSGTWGTFWEKVVCHLWCHISNDCTFTYGNWLALIQAIFDDSTLGDAQQWLKLMVILLGRKGLTNLGFLKVNDNDVLDPATDCTCT